MTLSILQSAEPSPRDQDPTAAEDQEETTPKALPPHESEGGDITVAPGEAASGEVMTTPSIIDNPTELILEEPEASTEGPTLEENPFGGSDNITVRPTYTFGEFEPTGSGMLPTSPEREEASPTAPVGEPEEPQSATEKDEKAEPEDDDGRAESKSNMSQNRTTHNLSKSNHK